MIFLVLLMGLGLMIPRLAILFLWLLTGWFTGMFSVWLWPVIGFFLAPYTLLWYSVVQNVYSGVWGPLQLIGLVVAIVFDLSSSSFGYRRYYRHGDHVDVVEEGVL